ncbi:helix-turn-helix domain-containing protein [Actinosynnema sp. NPDC053489]|uniref:helix-turn-helix domain-containing protein n=1 Tax=Actinosynnema sp. NPDC053489 TaxID=3363916 RepID=UPI0037CA1BAC
MDTELGDFLRSRRGGLRPEELGLASYGSRRVPGLRREELAQLAGVSVTYYTRLEQGQSQNVSDNVLDAIARALRLTDDEIDHLRDLAKPTRRKRANPARAEAVRPSTAQLIGAMEGVAVVAMDRRSDVLAWNALGHQLLAPHFAADSPGSAAQRPNLTRMLFLDQATRDLYVNWEDEARRSVASLRLVAGRHPDDRHLAELIGELCMKSRFFATLWSRHPVLNCTFGVKYFAHPQVGRLELRFEVVQMPDNSAHRMLMYAAEPGTPAEAALRLLGRGPVDEPSESIPGVVERSHRER